MRETPDNIVFRFPSDADEQRQQEIRDEALHDIEHGINVMELPGADQEIEKELWEEEVIEKVDDAIKKYFSEELNIQVTGTDKEHVHYYKRKDFEKVLTAKDRKVDPRRAQATAFSDHVLLTDEVRESPYPRFETTKLLIHEVLHSSEFKKFAEMVVTNGTDDIKVVIPERLGISMANRKRFGEHRFGGFQEGITELLKYKILYEVVRDDPLYQSELDARFANIDKKIGREKLFREWGVHAYDIIDGDIEKVDGDTTHFAWKRTGTYMDEQNLIIFLAKQISSSNRDQYPTIDHSLKLFFNAQYKGELLPLAREVDSTMGKGTFRLLAAIPESHQGGNVIAKNAFAYLRLPPEKRDPELARRYIFVQCANSQEQFDKYLSKVQKHQE